MSYQIKAPMDLGDDVLITDAAVAGLVGQRPTVDGHPGEVIAARKDEHGQVFVTLRVDGDPPADLLHGLSVSMDPQEKRNRELIARHLRVAASAVNITDWPAYLRRVADLHETGQAWYRP